MALKRARPKAIARQRIRREIEVQQQLAPHPSIMPILDHDPGFEWYTMPVALGTIEDLRERLGEDDLASILADVAGALEAAHGQGLVHRDVSLGNILALGGGPQQELRWVMADWGMVRRLAANVAVAEPSVVGRMIAAWPSCALIGSYELLMRQSGRDHDGRLPSAGMSSPVVHTNPPTGLAADASSDEIHTLPDGLPEGSYDGSDTGNVVPLVRSTDQVPAGDLERLDRGRGGPRHRRQVSRLQRQAWQWALAHRTPTGELPSGKVIGDRFGRGERWGRLVKQAGATGSLDPAVQH